MGTIHILLHFKDSPLVSLGSLDSVLPSVPDRVGKCVEFVEMDIQATGFKK